MDERVGFMGGFIFPFSIRLTIGAGHIVLYKAVVSKVYVSCHAAVHSSK